MNITEKRITPNAVCKVDSIEYRCIVSSVVSYIRASGRLWSAFLDLCTAKGFGPYTYLPKYAAYIVKTSCADTSTETDEDGKVETFGTFNLPDAMFTARVNLLGCPDIKEFIENEVAPFKIRARFYVDEGLLNASVEIVGERKYIDEGDYLRRIRDVLRCYGFGAIETIEENTADEPNGEVSIPTLASRNLP